MGNEGLWRFKLDTSPNCPSFGNGAFFFNYPKFTEEGECLEETLGRAACRKTAMHLTKRDKSGWECTQCSKGEVAGAMYPWRSNVLWWFCLQEGSDEASDSSG